MTIRVISQVIEEIFYAGRVKSDRKLTKKDFMMYGKMALANLMKLQYWNMRNADPGSEVYYIGNLIETRTFELPEPKSSFQVKRVIDLKDNPVIPLPLNMHVFAVDPVGQFATPIPPNMVQPGEEYHFKSLEFAHLPFFVVKSGRIETYHYHQGITKVEIEAVWDDETADIPGDIAFDIVNSVLGLTLKVAGFPIDKTDDNNPNVTTVKQRLADADPL